MPIPYLGTDACRLANIERARDAVMLEGSTSPTNSVATWIERSWRRCIHLGLHVQDPVTFAPVSQQQVQRTIDANQHLIQSAKPILENLGRTIVNTRYFAILTNAQGIVIDASGAIDHCDPRANLVARIGADLSEQSIGTTAICTALTELQPVWLHRGEHFFETTSVYSCAGAPLFGPDGACIGMLDVTGIDVQERPELKHLVRQSACKIENALLTAKKYALLMRLNWPGNAVGDESDGLLCLDADGWVTGANRAARQMVPGLNSLGRACVHVSEVFGIAYELLFDTALRPQSTLDIPLWSGLQLRALCVTQTNENQTVPTRVGAQTRARVPLKDLETALIHKTVTEARGNVAEAAKLLGISRATVYRKLGQRPTK